MPVHTKYTVVKENKKPTTIGASPVQSYEYGDCFYHNGCPVMIHVGYADDTMEAVSLDQGTFIRRVKTAVQGHITKNELIRLLDASAVPISEITVTFKL